MLLEEKKKISEVSEFSIFPCIQNRKLRNLGKCSFTSNFDNSCNLRFRNHGNEFRKKLKGQNMSLEEKRKLSRFLSFQFCPIPKIKNSEISESFLFLQIFTDLEKFWERERSLVFFVSFNFYSHLSWKSHWSSSSCSEGVEILSFHINLFINISGFLTFPCNKEINDVSI